MEENSESPLTLQHLQSAIEGEGKHVQNLNQNNATEICSLVQKLNLQFRGIGSLHLAWLLTNIEYLKLNNNILKSTSGLASLKTLKWLDLSFNKIQSVSGLQELTKLEVLALHENCIESLDENVFTSLPSLEVLTLGSNFIHEREDVLMLRRLPRLGSLTLKGNPCTQSDYPSYVIAHVPRLVYLDYERIRKEQREEANETHKDSLCSVETENERIQKESEALKQKQEEEAMHKMAGVYALNDDSLFRKLFEGDKEMEAMMAQHGVQATIDRFSEQFQGICIHVFQAGLLHAEQRHNELTQVKTALEEARNQSDNISRSEVAALDAEMNRLVERTQEIIAGEESRAALEDQEATEVREKKTAEFRDMIEEKLDSALMKLLENEVTLANQVKEVLELAEDELGNMLSTFLSDAAEDFEEGRGFAYSFYCRLREITTKLVDATASVMSQDTESSATDNIFEGSDTLTAALARIHDRHLDIINSREQELKDHLTFWLQDTLDTFYRREWKRHRTRLEEITTLSEEKRKDLSIALPAQLFISK